MIDTTSLTWSSLHAPMWLHLDITALSALFIQPYSYVLHMRWYIMDYKCFFGSSTLLSLRFQVNVKMLKKRLIRLSAYESYEYCSCFFKPPEVWFICICVSAASWRGSIIYSMFFFMADDDQVVYCRQRVLATLATVTHSKCTRINSWPFIISLMLDLMIYWHRSHETTNSYSRSANIV